MAQHGRRGRLGCNWPWGFVISAASIWFLLRLIDLHEVTAALSVAQWPFLLTASGTYFVSLTLRAWRWTFLLTPVKPLSLHRVWPVTALGYAANLVLPARLGELFRTAVLRTRGVPMSAGLATVTAERVIDGLTTVALLLLTLPLLPTTAPQWLLTGGRVVGIVFIAGLLALWLLLIRAARGGPRG